MANPYATGLEKKPANYQPLPPLAFLARAARVYPNHTAIVHGAKRTSYRDYYARTRALAGALKGAGDTRFVMYYSVAMAWGVLVSGIVVIVFVLDGSILHAWAWLTFHVMVLAIGFVWRFRSGCWKSIDLLGRHPTLPEPRPSVEALVVSD